MAKGISVAQVKKYAATDSAFSQQQFLYRGLADLISNYHYAPPKFDDSLSARIYTNYLNKLDPNKAIFLKTDISRLDSFRYLLDDELKGQRPALAFFTLARKIYLQRIQELENMPLLKNDGWRPGYTNEVLLSKDNLHWCLDNKSRMNRWDKLISYQLFIKQADLATGFKDVKERDRRAQLSVFNKYKHWFSNELKSEDDYKSFADYINVIAYILDPHSEYQPPVSKAKYDQQMSNMFFGIGLTLGATDQGDIKVVTLINGMPAWNSKMINTGDILLSISQNSTGSWEDIDGWEIPEVVERIRGKQGTTVRLKIKDSKTGKISEIPLVREKVSVQESGARSGIILSTTGKKTGIIQLPEFYNDYAHWDGAKSANDIARELNLLKKENIDALVVDLRYNGGGSLEDVVKISGYFINHGPIVQIKDHKGALSILSDEDGVTLYDGPMVVLVNGYSASASEIFAATMQDYKRAIIIGANTYGKGTVQHQIPLGPQDGFGEPKYGAMKLTMEKFYRINGATTQKTGVHPDVYLPDLTSYAFPKEKDAFSVLTADAIGSVNYRDFEHPVIDSMYAFNQYLKGRSRSIHEMDSLVHFLSSKPVKKIGFGYAYNQNKSRQIAMANYKKLEKIEPSELKTIGIGDYQATEWYKSWLNTTVSNSWIRAAIEIITDRKQMAGSKSVVNGK
ncbi:S41 family peptidase [Pedobacter petrophilus]|uniref:S41 family peptidase n=1 Tax=Pedobacter petrophilus TaxID=1908241 RepID=UPI003642D9DE